MSLKELFAKVLLIKWRIKEEVKFLKKKENKISV